MRSKTPYYNDDTHLNDPEAASLVNQRCEVRRGYSGKVAAFNVPTPIASLKEAESGEVSRYPRMPAEIERKEMHRRSLYVERNNVKVQGM